VRAVTIAISGIRVKVQRAKTYNLQDRSGAKCLMHVGKSALVQAAVCDCNHFSVRFPKSPTKSSLEEPSLLLNKQIRPGNMVCVADLASQLQALNVVMPSKGVKVLMSKLGPQVPTPISSDLTLVDAYEVGKPLPYLVHVSVFVGMEYNMSRNQSIFIGVVILGGLFNSCFELLSQGRMHDEARMVYVCRFHKRQ
jgi:hypothetical protein